MTNIYSPSFSLRSLYDAIGEMTAEARHNWINFHSPSKDDIEWDRIRLSIRVKSVRDKYFEQLMRDFFHTSVSITYDDQDLDGFKGWIYTVTLEPGKPKSGIEPEGSSEFKDYELKNLRDDYIRDFRIYAIRNYDEEEANKMNS